MSFYNYKHGTQLGSLTNCSISLVLLVPGFTARWQEAFAQQLTILAAWLHKRRQLTLKIFVHQPVPGTWVPLPYTLQLIQDHLHQFDLYSVLPQHPAVSEASSVTTTPFAAPEHFEAVAYSQTSVCTCFLPVYASPMHAVARILTAMGSMQCLSKLHITLSPDYGVEEVDFQMLAQLSCLEDLALQCSAAGGSCQGVLQSNRQTLHSVTLSATSWSVATYNSLQDVPRLDNLTISIVNITHGQAQALGGITASAFDLKLLKSPEGWALETLNACQPRIHALTVWPAPYSLLCLPELPSLQHLNLADSGFGYFTGTSLHSYPHVTQLTFINCPCITGDGLQHIIRQALPGLKSVSFHATTSGHQKFELSLRALDAFQFGRNLQYIDLRGISGLTKERVAKLEKALHRKQRKNAVQPMITILLPSPCLGTAEPLLKVKHVPQLPNIQMIETRLGVHKLVVKSQRGM